MPETTAMLGARALAAAMTDARKDAGMGQRKLARILGHSHSLLSDWENAKKTPSIEEVAAYLQGLGVVGKAKEQILDLARDAGEENWLTVGAPGASKALAGVLECERTATNIFDWSPMVIPGLLQTSAYARAILGAGDRPRTHVDAAVTYRLGRRDIITRVGPAPLEAIVGESALRQVIGGSKVMADQLRYLGASAELETVTLRVVPEHGDWHPGLIGPFVLYEFERAPRTVLLEHHRSSVFLTDAEDIAEYQVAAEILRERAISPDQASELIANIAATLERGSHDDSA